MITNETLLLQALDTLPPSKCLQIMRLADPSGTGRLSDDQLQQIRDSLTATCKQLNNLIGHMSSSDAGLVRCLHEALLAVLATVDTVHDAG